MEKLEKSLLQEARQDGCKQILQNTTSTQEAIGLPGHLACSEMQTARLCLLKCAEAQNQICIGHARTHKERIALLDVGDRIAPQLAEQDPVALLALLRLAPVATHMQGPKVQ